MAISRSSALLCAACAGLVAGAAAQAPAAPPPADSLTALQARLARDSSDGRTWLLVGRSFLQRADDAHTPPHRTLADSAAVRALLDTADHALTRAAELLGPSGTTPEGDSARVLRAGAWAARTWLAWEEKGINVGPQEWGPVPGDLKLPPVLEELGENLLRACPMWGVLLTAHDADSYAAWYMRFARGLRPDLVILPLAAWRSDSLLRTRIGSDWKLGRRGGADPLLAELAKRRPVCVSMAFDRPPEPPPRIAWAARPLVWVAGPRTKDDRVPPHDFVFAALRLALDNRQVWAAPAILVYARAARATPALCDVFATYRVANDIASCRR